MRIRSILWVGPAELLAASGLPDAAGYDVVWEREPERLRELPLDAFDAVVLSGDACDRRAFGRRQPALPVVRWGEEVVDRASLDDRLAKVFAEERSNASDDLGLVGSAPALREVRFLVERAAGSAATVLILGETGTGKELVARAVHTRSARRRQPFVAVNCAAFPDTLLESELLGHARGAFSGAERERKGLLEEANGGTLFLDEVAETSPAFQAKLLRVLQERVVRPLGANRERAIDVRVVAATHRDLLRAVRDGRFRQDLYYRLAVFPIPLPALRERRADLRSLVAHFLDRHGAPQAKLAPEVWPLLEAHPWPGNVRELENEVQHALALADPGAPLERRHFSARLGAAAEPVDALGLPPDPGEPLRETVARLEALLIRRALQAHGHRRSETAKRLGLTREGLYKKMKRLGIG